MSPWRILVVDDEPQTREEHATNLQDWYEVFCAEGQGQALIEDAQRKARENRCHLALVDMRLLDGAERNDTSGLDLVEKLKPTESIIVTAYANEPRFSRLAKQKGALSVFGKQEGPEALREELARGLYDCGYRNELKIEWPDDFRLHFGAHAFSAMDPDDFFAEAQDLLCRMFPKARSLQVFDVSSNSESPSRTLPPHSLVLRVRQDDNSLFDLVKISRANRSTTEALRFSSVRDKFSYPPAARVKVTPIVLWEIGGVAYDYLPDYWQLEPKLFAQYYIGASKQSIRKALQRLQNYWAPLYREKEQEYKERLLQAYCAAWGNERWLKRLLLNWNSLRQTIDYPSGFYGIRLPDPRNWFVDRVGLRCASETNGNNPLAAATNNLDEVSIYYDASLTPLTEIAVTHGDLHADNFFVTKQGDVCVIDYEHTGKGPILQDWVALEEDILTRLLEVDEQGWPSYAQLMLLVTGAQVCGRREPAKASPSCCLSPAAEKAWETICEVRKLAKKSAGVEELDMEPYYWGLLCNALFRMMRWWKQYADLDQRIVSAKASRAHIEQRERLRVGIQQCLVLAGALCQRLDYWGAPWPPEEWRVFQEQRSTQ